RSVRTAPGSVAAAARAVAVGRGREDVPGRRGRSGAVLRAVLPAVLRGQRGPARREVRADGGNGGADWLRLRPRRRALSAGRLPMPGGSAGRAGGLSGVRRRV